jgi:ABC-type methionine transport system ATPase subunit
MLLDEVTSALDPELVTDVLGIVRELKESGMTMVLATHEMGFARDIADTVCFLHDGALLERGPAEQIFTEPREPHPRVSRSACWSPAGCEPARPTGRRDHRFSQRGDGYGPPGRRRLIER